MPETQSFRLIGKNDVEKITCGKFDGQNIVYWEDIKLLFPGVKHVKNGDVLVAMMKDQDGNV